MRYLVRHGESLEIAKKIIDYLDGQLKDSTDINKKFKRNPETYFSLYLLPYMKS